MTQRRQRTSHVTSAVARFHRRGARCQIAYESDHTVTAHPPSEDNLAAFDHDAAAVLARVDAQDNNADEPLLCPMNTDILRGGRREWRAIHQGGREWVL
jgi:hypothetical protein